MAITKPPVIPAWAESGDKVTPSNAEIQVGWPLSSIPPSRQRFNWLLNFLANGIRYFTRRGLPDYDAAETYMTGDRIIGDDGNTYRSLIDNNTAQTPSAQPTKWELWALTQAQSDLRVQKASAISSAAGGTADAITGIYTPGISTLANGMTLYVRASSANATTTPTFTPASGTIAAKQIVKGNGVAVVAGDIAGGGHWVELQYDLSLDKWVLLNPATGMATVTSTNDASFADNSVKPASTSWVRGAMSAIATAAGFAASISGNGYVKFPSWLGGWIIQWGGTAVLSSTADVITTFPIAFQNNIYSVICTQNYTAGSGVVSYGGHGNSGLTGFVSRSNATGNGYRFIAIGN